MSSAIEQAIRQIVEEKGLAYESVIEAIETALAAAYRKDFGHRMQNLEAKFNPENGSVRVWDVKTVVEDQEIAEVPEEDEKEERFDRPPRREEKNVEEEGAEPKFNPKTQVMVSKAKAELKSDAEIGEVIRTEQEVPGEFGRMAAMTAKQVITQKLREAEREVLYNEYKDQEGEVLVGTVQRREGRVVLVDIGRGTAVMRPEDQIPGERYVSGDRIKVYLRSVDLGMRGPEVLVSRTAPELVLALFKTEIPEIADGTVRIEAIAREAGSRSKVAVACDDNSIDPIGACIGQRGARIQTIIAELGIEKVDIIEYDADPGVFVMNALSPAKVQRVELNDADKIATVMVGGDQLSLAIGRGGQNVRLAARLTGWRINVAEEDGTVKGSSEGAVDRKKGTPTPPSVAAAPDTSPRAGEEAAIVEEAKIEEEAREEEQQAEITEEMKQVGEAQEGDADLVDAEDENDDGAEEVEEGLAAEEMPSEAAEEADETQEKVEE